MTDLDQRLSMNQAPGAGSDTQPATRSSVLVRLLKATGVDRAVGFTVLGRGWNTLSGAVTILLVARFLTPAEQGYYYTFASLVALQVVFELGFSFVILQMASHERVHLSIAKDHRITGDTIAHARLASVLQLSVRWYLIAALLMAIIVTPAGMLFFATHQRHGALVPWELPWISAVLATFFTFQIDPI